jgi:hypothetical protein
MAPEEKRKRDVKEREDERRAASWHGDEEEERTPLGQKGKLSAEDDNDSGGG